MIQHAPHEHPAVIRRALESQGIQTLWIHPYRGEAFPSADEIAGLISLGGPMSANDEQKNGWIKPEIRLMEACLSAQIPIVGICLGGQLLARALGSRVEKNTVTEIGWFPIDLTEQGSRDSVVGVAGQRPTVYHWHGETFHLPDGATLLASSNGCPRQAYRVGETAYGFQFHPEADHQLITEWLSIEGVEEEIASTRKCHGTTTIQDACAQRDNALRGEKASLKITAAIGALFRRHPIKKPRRETSARIRMLAARRIKILVEFEGSARKIVRLRGEISSILSIPAGDFILFKEDNTLLWPIRVPDLISISPLE